MAAGYTGVENCPLPLVDLEPLAFFTREVTLSDVVLLESSDFTTETITVTPAAPETFDYPDASFDLPAQVCIDNCTLPTGVNNENAGAVEWFFENGIPETSDEKMPGQICFTEPGLHTVRQTIFFGDCEESYEEIIAVLPVPQVEFQNEETLCPDETITFDASTENADTYLWNTGENTATLLAGTPGTYSVTVSNAACSETASITVNLVNPDVYPIVLPPDTSVCRQNLPFILSPVFNSGDTLVWQDGTARSDYSVTQSGNYTAVLNADGCLFSAQTNVEVNDCSEKIYIPNVFSPNNDGINDLFKIEGSNFTTIKMSIYDRWGNQIFESKIPGAAWNGESRSGAADPGIYLYVISYQNEISGTTGVVSGDVMITE